MLEAITGDSDDQLKIQVFLSFRIQIVVLKTVIHAVAMLLK